MTVKLTDFGIARAAEQTRLTQVGSVVGTAAYLAPEQARGEEAAPASDVYALGVVIYQLLTGRLPWEGTSLAELAIRRENERPLPPSSYDSAMPETLSTAVLRSLEGDPALRYSTARQLAVALRDRARAGSSRRRPTPRRRPGRCPAARPRPRVACAPEASPRRARRRRRSRRAPRPRPAPAEPRARPLVRQPHGQRDRHRPGDRAAGRCDRRGGPADHERRAEHRTWSRNNVPDQIQSIQDFLNSHMQ